MSAFTVLSQALICLAFFINFKTKLHPIVKVVGFRSERGGYNTRFDLPIKTYGEGLCNATEVQFY